MTDVAEVAERATETKGERTRRRLLEIAVERFGARGYRSTSVSEIARTAGLTQAAAYAYFDGKEAMFVAAVDADASALIAETMADVGDVHVRHLAPNFVMAALEALDRHPLTRRVLTGQEPEVVARLLDLSAVRDMSARLAGEIRRGQLEGDVRTDIDAEVIAAGIESLVLSLIMSMVMISGAATTRHQLGTVKAFDAMLSPPA